MASGRIVPLQLTPCVPKKERTRAQISDGRPTKLRVKILKTIGPIKKSFPPSASL